MNDFTVASWQTLKSNGRWRRLVGMFDLIVVDEAHDQHSPDSIEILDAMVDAGARVLGVSATFYRSGNKIMPFYDKVSYTYTIQDAIRDGFLCPAKAFVHYVESITVKGVKSYAGDFAPRELDDVLFQEGALHDIANLYVKHHVPGVKAMLFCHSIRQAQAMQEILGDRYGHAASLVHSKHPEREYQLEQFTKGDNELMIVVASLIQGWDHPPVAEIFLARPTKSLGRYVQTIGRGTRTLDGVLEHNMNLEQRLAAIAASAKPCFTVHDITDSSRHHRLCSCIDVMASPDAKPEAIQRVKKRAEKEGITDVDAAVLEEEKRLQDEARQKREIERERRRKVVTGVKFSSYERDLFQDGDRDSPNRREWRMPFGKYRGKPMRIVPDSYLEWMLRASNLNSFWKSVVSDHLNQRQMKVRG